MNRTLRIVLVIVGVVVALVLIAPLVIPVGQFKPMMEEKASAALGRKVQLGNLSLSLLSGSVRVGNVSIGDDPRFSQSPFLTAQSVKVGVKLLPLIFSKTLEVTSLTIERPDVTLLRNAAGEWNFSTLGASGSNPASVTASAAQGTKFLVGKLNIEDGKISIGSTSSPKRSVYNHVGISASNVSPTSEFPLKITAGLPGGGEFSLEGNAGPLNETDASLTPLEAKLRLRSLNLASSGFLDSSLGLGGILDLSASLASKGGEGQTSGTVRLSRALLVAGGSPAAEPVTIDFNTQYDLRKDTGVLNPSTVKIGNATAHLSGTYEVTGANPVVHITVTGDNMPARDLVAFLPALGIHLPNGARLQAGTLNANLSVAGPTNAPVTTGQVGLFRAKLAGFDLGSAMSGIASLAGVKTGKDLLIEKLTTGIKVAPTGLAVDNFLAVVPSVGTLIGGGTIDAKNNLDFKMAAKLATASAGSPMAVVGGVLGAFEGCKNAGIPFQIKGTTSNPKFIPDVGGLAANMLKSELGCVPGAAGGTQQGQRQNPVNTIMGLFGKKKP